MAELNRTLSFPTLLIITINSIMGTGIFFLPAVGAREAGPASIISWLIMSILAVAVGFIFGELVGMYPKSGGVYEYTKQAFGTFPSFIFGWMTLIAANVTIAMLVVGAVRYLNPALPGIAKITISIGIVVMFNYMAYRGMETSAVMLVAFGLVTLVTLLGLTVPGFFSFSTKNITPFFTHSADKVLLTIFLVAETFFGWETATFLAEETKDPERTMPRALWLGTIIIAILSLVFVVISLGNVPWQQFGLEKAPLSYLGIAYYGSGIESTVSMLVYLSIIGSVAGWVVAAPRLIMSLAKDKLFIQQFADIHEEHRTPHKAIFFQTIVTSILIVVGSGSYEILLELLVPIVLIMYAGVIGSFVLMRFTKPEQKRPFKVRFGVPLGILVILMLLAIFTAWAVTAHNAPAILQLAGSFIFAGVPVYLLLTYFYNPDALIRTMNRLAFLNLWFESLLVPKRVRREVLQFLSDARNKHVLEFGSGVGGLTLYLAEHVGSKGRVTALDVSEHNIRILKSRLEKRGHAHVSVVHDPHLVNRVHPDVQNIDMVVSLGNLSYLQDIEKVLQELAQILPRRGKLCFVEYIDMFFFLPNNPKWVKDPDEVQRIFNKAGFSVNLQVKRGMFWNYLYIYGVKEERDVPYI